jgi:phosphoglucomutase
MIFKGDNPGSGEDTAGQALEGMILSASGWRGVFAADGDEESETGDISPARRIFAAAAAEVFAAWLGEGGSSPRIIVGTDTRPTGKAMAGAVIPVLLAKGNEVLYAGITAAPEIMAYARSFSGPGTGFIYISASHNPIGHNGLKFGLTDGGILPAPEAAELSTALHALLASPDQISRLEGLINCVDPAALRRMEEILARAGAIKKAAHAAYLAFAGEVAFGGQEPGTGGGSGGGDPAGPFRAAPGDPLRL